MSQDALHLLTYFDLRMICSKANIRYSQDKKSQMIEKISTFLNDQQEGYELIFEYRPN